MFWVYPNTFQYIRNILEYIGQIFIIKLANIGKYSLLNMKNVLNTFQYILKILEYIGQIFVIKLANIGKYLLLNMKNVLNIF